MLEALGVVRGRVSELALWSVSTTRSSSSCALCFFKQKTAYELRISDWSSDVCSSDLSCRYANRRQAAARLCAPPALRPYGYCPVVARHPVPPRAATDRKSVV